ncbi:MAG: hypothetical protein GXX79_02090 [Actinomycetales bacterium]|nr:hypothetical protein [Actinomycetales bacterium]
MVVLGLLADVAPDPTGVDPAENTALGVTLLVVTALAVLTVAVVLIRRRRR